PSIVVLCLCEFVLPEALALPLDRRIAVLDPRGKHEFVHCLTPYKISSRPPSTTNVVPVINRASGAARKQIAAAISSGLPIAPSIFSAPLFTFGLFHSIGVSTAPGATQLIRIFFGANSSLNPRVNASIPPFDEA